MPRGQGSTNGLFWKMPADWYPLGRETQPTLLCFKCGKTWVHPSLRKATQGTNGFSAPVADRDSGVTDGSASTSPASCKLPVK